MNEKQYFMLKLFPCSHTTDYIIKLVQFKIILDLSDFEGVILS